MRKVPLYNNNFSEKRRKNMLGSWEPPKLPLTAQMGPGFEDFLGPGYSGSRWFGLG